jgi:Thioesterase-like superfamily
MKVIEDGGAVNLGASRQATASTAGPGDAAPGAGSSFADATAVTPAADGIFAARIPPEWGFRGRPHGGFLLAIGARAAMCASQRPHPHVVSGSFIRSAESGAAEVHVELIKQGRLITHAHATLSQHGNVVVAAQVTVGEPDRDQPSWLQPPDPPPAPYERCVPVPRRPGRTGLLERLDIRYDPAAAPDLHGGTGAARICGWVRLRDEGPSDALAAVLAADALPPSVLNLGVHGWAPTVHMTVYLRRPPAPGPLAVSVAARLVAGRWFDEVADVYDASGALVAQGRQLAMMPRDGGQPTAPPGG